MFYKTLLCLPQRGLVEVIQIEILHPVDAFPVGLIHVVLYAGFSIAILQKRAPVLT